MKNREKYAIVLGSSQRLGRSIALYFAKKGYHIAIHYKCDIQSAQETLALVEQLGVKGILVQKDITHIEEIEALLKEVLTHFPYLNTVVNCVSIFEKGDIEQVDEQQWEQDQAIHQKGPFFLTKALYEYTKREKQELALIHLTDAHTRHPKASRPSYYVAKSALEAQIRVAAVSVAPYMRVNGVAPGLIIPNNEKEALYFVKREQEIPLKALATTSDIAKAVYFLAHNRAITGQTLIVDGGEWLL